MNKPLLLAPCRACEKEISTSIARCPNCGTQNNFVHPNISKFLAQEFDSFPKFSYNYTGTAISGKCVDEKVFAIEKIRNILFGVAFLLWVFLRAPFSMLGVFLFFVALGVAAYGVKFRLKEKSFSVNYSTGYPVWQSDDDAFWAPVKSVLVE